MRSRPGLYTLALLLLKLRRLLRPAVALLVLLLLVAAGIGVYLRLRNAAPGVNVTGTQRGAKSPTIGHSYSHQR